MLIHQNSYSGSRIKSVTTINAADRGYPRFSIDGDGWYTPSFPSDQIADFLNDATGINGGEREISGDLEAAVFAAFSDVLQKTEEQYVYTGAKIADRANFARLHGVFAGTYKELKRKYYERESLIETTNAIGIQEKRGDFTSDEAQSIGQHEIGLTNHRSTKPILGTTGAWPCIIVAAYNREIKEALLTHIDSRTDLTSLRMYLDKMGGSAGNKLEIHVHGGDNTTRGQVAEIVGLINQRSDTEIISAVLCTGTGGEGRDLALDSRTGEVFTIFNTYQLHRDEMYPGIQPPATPLILSFDGTREAMGKFTASVDDTRSGGGEVSR